MKHRLLFGLFSALVLILLITNCCNESEEPRKGKSNAIFNPDKTYGTVKDIDGNEYKTITIGSQTWMAENLRTTHYRNGDPIPNITDNTQWGMRTSGAYCSYKNTKDVDSIATHGLLYNGYTVTDNRGLAPEGWHIPTDSEWTTLINCVDNGDGITDGNGTNSIVGGRLKETDTLHWGRANQADNSSGFTAIPGGERNSNDGVFWFINYSCIYWSSTEYIPNITLLVRILGPDFLSITRGQYPDKSGNSVRCVKD